MPIDFEFFFFSLVFQKRMEKKKFDDKALAFMNLVCVGVAA